ncbi:MAG: glycosyltransferase family 2 protein [Bacteroidota bacterium]
MKKPKQNIWIIVPAFNEGRVLAGVLQSLQKSPYQILVVDDGSDDDSRKICHQVGVHCIRHKVNLGQGAALQTGMDFCQEIGAEMVVHFDADGQHRVEDIDRLLAQLQLGKGDVILGSRFLTKEDKREVPFQRRMLLQMARILQFLLTGLWLSDAHNGLRALNRKALCAIKLEQSGRAHATEILQQIKEKELSYAEVPVHITYSHYSTSKGTSIWDAFQVLEDLLVKRKRQT